MHGAMIRGTLQTHGDGDTRGDMGKFGHRSRNNGRSGLLKYAQFTCLSVQGRNKNSQLTKPSDRRNHQSALTVQVDMYSFCSKDGYM